MTLEIKKEDQSEASIDRYEESNRIKLWRNAATYPSTYSIFKSEKLDWRLTKIKKIKNFKYFQTNSTFPDDQRNSNSPFKKFRSKHMKYIFNWRKIIIIKSQEIANLVNNRFDLNFSKRTVQRNLKEIGYKYVGYKIKSKMILIIKRLD